MVTLLVFLAATTFAFGVMALVRVQGSVKRRAAGIGRLTDERGGRSALAARIRASRPRSG